MTCFFPCSGARNSVLMTLSLLLLSGCAFKRDKYELPALNLPAQYTKSPSAVDAPHALNNSPRPSTAASLLLNVKLTEWWRLLGSQELNHLMDRALANNPDLRISTLRIAQSKARFSQSGADKLPAISMPVQSSTSYPENGAGNGRANGNNKSKTIHQFSLKGVWRPDIWGETAALNESAELQLLRATYQRDDMQRNVVANMVVAYLEYLSLNDRLRVARETEKSLSEMLASVDGRLKMGDATITELEQQKAAVYSVKATIPVLEQQREIVLNRLAALLGSAPVELKLSQNGLNSVAFPQVLPDMPSALLLRRPDVRAAEFRLLSADADIDVARARILPPLDLTAQIGYGSMHLSQMLLPQSLFWNTIANLTVSIFDSGKRFREVDFARAVHEELLETYVRVIYDAVREVDDSLSGLNYMGKRLETQGLATDSALHAWNYSQEAFMAGAVDYLVLLDTQRTYQRNLDDWHNVRLDRYRSLVNLFNALGGGILNNDLSVDEETFIQSLTAASSLRAASAERNQDEANKPGSIDWTGSLLKDGKPNWLVELSGVYDGAAVLPAWRDLNTRFPREIESYSLLPQRQDQITVRDRERASWYRLFVAGLPDKQAAESFCALLSAGHQRCSVVSSESISGKGDFIAPPALTQQISSATWAVPAAMTTDLSNNSAKEPSPSNVSQDAAGQQDGQSTAVAIQAAIVPTPQVPKQFNGAERLGRQFWLVALTDVHYRNSITAAWRSLITQFPAQMKDKVILPRTEPMVSPTSGEEAHPYRLYIARFAERQTAEEFCSMLRDGQQRCSVVSSQSFAEKEGAGAPLATDRGAYQGSKP